MSLTTTRPVTVYDHLAAGLPLRNESMQLPAQIQINGEVLIPLGDDDGNGKKKLALLNRSAEVITVEIPASYMEAKEIRMGKSLTTYQVNNGPLFWIGEDAVRSGGDALPIGPTAQRLSDQRHRDFGAACVVEILRKGGFSSGTYRLAVARAIPNEEIKAKKKEDDAGGATETLAVKKETRTALKEHLLGKTFSVVRTDEDGREEQWTITYAQVVPQAQSVGTFVAYTRDLYGRNQMGDIEAMRINDIGGGDDQIIEVIHDRGNWRMTTKPRKEGTIGLARALARQFPRLSLNDAQAQFALENRYIRNDAGRRQVIDLEIRRVMDSEGQDMVAQKLPLLQEPGFFLLFTGGGIRIPELRAMIAERAMVAGKEEETHFAFVDPTVSGVMNAFGVLMLLIFATSGRSI
ncbi:hypothetical protein [Herpetosiphon giganteus]|uniref:hypothetical protein n=1 Tax=Herpetosiphon giganteus TaxID=2029754 RepID=UPI00195E3735|nr:hypothetical protein [Herpetosiphon giganteus]MBM7846288.1 hypothetical protein [Herpetosiphon giganteus]